MLRVHKGFSLIEIMIALAIGLIVITMVLWVVQSARRASEQNAQISTLQENARIALDVMEADLRNAGRLSVRSLGQAFSSGSLLNTSNKTILSSFLPIWGVKGNSAPSRATIDSDSLSIAATDPCWARTATDMGSPQAPVSVFNPMLCAFDNKDFIIIEDMQDATLFRISGQRNGTLLHESPLNQLSGLSHAYPAGSWLTKLNIPTYQIKENSASSRLELVSIDQLSGRQLYIAEGVIRLRFRYGYDEDNDGAPDEFRLAHQIDALSWYKVKSVEMIILMQEIQPSGMLPNQTVSFPNAVTGKDEVLQNTSGRLWKVFRRTVALRHS